MTTTVKEIREWLLQAKKEGATHMIVVCDTFDHDDYPVNVSRDEDVRKVHQKYDGVNMQRVMEVYNLRMDIEGQLGKRVMNFDCPHKNTGRGKDAPRRYGSWQTEVCKDCGDFRTHDHDTDKSHKSEWKPAEQYETAVAVEEE